jgi:hypothetical protein
VRCHLAIAVLVAGCSFPGNGGTAPDGGIGGPDGPDGPRPDAMGPPPIDAIVQPALCGVAPEPALRLCIDFEDNDPAVASDNSGRGNHAALMNVVPTTRGLSTAAHCGGDCEMRIAESSSLDLSVPVTIALWVRAEDDPPTLGRFGLLDNNTQYSLFYQADHTVTCSMFRNQSQPTTVRSAALAPGAWNHVACVADGSTLAIYVDGQFSLSTTFTSSLHTGNDQGTLLAEDLEGSGAGNETLVGAIDDVRIWSRGLSASEVCQLAGQTGC